MLRRFGRETEGCSGVVSCRGCMTRTDELADRGGESNEKFKFAEVVRLLLFAFLSLYPTRIHVKPFHRWHGEGQRATWQWLSIENGRQLAIVGQTSAGLARIRIVRDWRSSGAHGNREIGSIALGMRLGFHAGGGKYGRPKTRLPQCRDGDGGVE